MSNQDYTEIEPRKSLGNQAKPPSPGTPKAKSKPSVNERTANWPGVPGKTQSDRSLGVKRVKQVAREGI